MVNIYWLSCNTNSRTPCIIFSQKKRSGNVEKMGTSSRQNQIVLIALKNGLVLWKNMYAFKTIDSIEPNQLVNILLPTVANFETICKLILYHCVGYTISIACFI